MQENRVAGLAFQAEARLGQFDGVLVACRDGSVRECLAAGRLGERDRLRRHLGRGHRVERCVDLPERVVSRPGDLGGQQWQLGDLLVVLCG
jgi:hypothetical protein